MNKIIKIEELAGTKTPLDAVCSVLCYYKCKKCEMCSPKCFDCIEQGGRILAELMRNGYKLLQVVKS